MGKSKKLKFEVTLDVMQLLAVPYMNAIFFVKVKHKDASQSSLRQPVQNHQVSWNQTFTFSETLVATDGLLVQHDIIVSVRKEINGGKSYEKIGHVNLNLAQYAGRGKTERRFLLQPEKKSSRQDNSLILVAVSMRLVEGDPVYKPMDLDLDGGLDNGIDSAPGAKEPLALASVLGASGTGQRLSGSLAGTVSVGSLELADFRDLSLPVDTSASFPRRRESHQTHQRSASDGRWKRGSNPSETPRLKADDVVAELFGSRHDLLSSRSAASSTSSSVRLGDGEDSLASAATRALTVSEGLAHGAAAPSPLHQHLQQQSQQQQQQVSAGSLGRRDGEAALKGRQGSDTM